MTVDGPRANSGGILPESFRVSSGNPPHPMGSVKVGDTLGDRGFEVTAPIQSGPSMQALRPSTVSGFASSGGALHRSSLGSGANWSRDTQPEMIGLGTPEGTGVFFNGPVVSGMDQIGNRGGYPAEHRQMTTDEHRLWSLKLQAEMIGRAALLKAIDSRHVQQRSIDYERQIQALQAALDAHREAEVVINRRAEEAPATPSERGDGNNATHAHPSCLNA